MPYVSNVLWYKNSEKISIYDWERERIEVVIEASEWYIYIPTAWVTTAWTSWATYSWDVSVDWWTAVTLSWTWWTSTSVQITASAWNHTVVIKPHSLWYWWARAFWYSRDWSTLHPYASTLKKIIYDWSYMWYAESRWWTGNYFRHQQYYWCTAITSAPVEFLPEWLLRIGNMFRSAQYWQCTSLVNIPDEYLPSSVRYIWAWFRIWQYSITAITKTAVECMPSAVYSVWDSFRNVQYLWCQSLVDAWTEVAIPFTSWISTSLNNYRASQFRLCTRLTTAQTEVQYTWAIIGNNFKQLQYQWCSALTTWATEVSPTSNRVWNYYRNEQYKDCTSLVIAPAEASLTNVTTVWTYYRAWQYNWCTALTTWATELILPVATSIWDYFRAEQYSWCTALVNISNEKSFSWWTGSSYPAYYRYRQYLWCTHLVNPAEEDFIREKAEYNNYDDLRISSVWNYFRAEQYKWCTLLSRAPASFWLSRAQFTTQWYSLSYNLWQYYRQSQFENSWITSCWDIMHIFESSMYYAYIKTYTWCTNLIVAPKFCILSNNWQLWYWDCCYQEMYKWDTSLTTPMEYVILSSSFYWAYVSFSQNYADSEYEWCTSLTSIETYPQLQQWASSYISSNNVFMRQYYWCTSLTTVVEPNFNITDYSTYTSNYKYLQFGNCTWLTNVTLNWHPNEPRISQFSWAWNSTTPMSINIPATTANLAVSSSMWLTNANVAEINVPCNLVQTYRSSANWSEITDSKFHCEYVLYEDLPSMTHTEIITELNTKPAAYNVYYTAWWHMNNNMIWDSSTDSPLIVWWYLFQYDWTNWAELMEESIVIKVAALSDWTLRIPSVSTHDWDVIVDWGTATRYSDSSMTTTVATWLTPDSEHTVIIMPHTIWYWWAIGFNYRDAIEVAQSLKGVIFDRTYMWFASSSTSTGNSFRSWEYANCRNLTTPVQEYLPNTVTSIWANFRSWQYAHSWVTTTAYEELPTSVVSIWAYFRASQYEDCTSLTTATETPLGTASALANFRDSQYYWCTSLTSVSINAESTVNPVGKRNQQFSWAWNTTTPMNISISWSAIETGATNSLSLTNTKVAKISVDPTLVTTYQQSSKWSNIDDNKFWAATYTQTFNYTWADQTFTVPFSWQYRIMCYWAWSNTSAWWYVEWIATLNWWDIYTLVVWQSWSSVWWTWITTYWFWWSSNYSTNRAWWWLSWVFSWSSPVAATDSARALIIAWWAWWWCPSSGRNWWMWWWTEWQNWQWSNYWTAWWWGTQSWRNSWGNVWANQFNGWNGSWTYWYWWWGWWYWGNSSIWDGSGDDDKWAGWGSWYVASSLTSTKLIQWWWSAKTVDWKIIITTQLTDTYQEVTYVESTWTQFINTWLTLNPDTTYDFKFQLSEASWNKAIIWARWSSNAYRHSLITYNNQFHFMLGNSSAWNWSPIDTDVHIVTMSWGNSSWTVVADGTTYTASASISANSGCPYYLFSNWSDTLGSVKIYSAVFRKSWTEVRRFIPCYRTFDNEIWFYDSVNSVFYSNGWSWTFLKWPDVWQPFSW